MGTNVIIWSVMIVMIGIVVIMMDKEDENE